MVMPLHVPLPEYTVADLEGFPDDGCRYELLKAGEPKDVRHAESLSWHPAPLPAPLVLDIRALFA